MRRLVFFALVSLCLVPNAAAADASWAQPQIKRVVEAGLLAAQVATFKPQKPLTQKALAGTLEALSLASEEPVDYRYLITAPGRAVTIRELDAALVGFLGLGDSARSVTGRSETRASRPGPALVRRRSPACLVSASTTRRRRTRSSSA